MHQPLKRRTFLKATGVSLALPLLETMSPALGSAPAAAPKRMVCICTTLGLHPPSLWPRTSGADYESTEYLDLLKDHRKDFTLFSGLEHEGQTGRDPHNCELTWLTAAQGPGLGGFRNSISVDQYAAEKLGYVTRFPSVVISSNSAKSQSFTSSGVMVPAERSPAKLFSKMFLKGNARQVEKQKRRLSDGRSILDSLRPQAKKLQRGTSRSDNRQLDEYYESIRKAEKELAEVQAWMAKPKPKVEAPPPDDIRDKRNLVGRTQLLMNMVPLILQTDSSRVVAVMIQDHYSVPQVDGVSLEHHNLSHHGRDKSKIKQLKKIESALVNCFGSLLAQLKAKKEGAGTLLGSSSVLFGSNLGNANSHDPRNLPIFLAGGGFRHGSYVARKKDGTAPLCNLFVSMLNRMGFETESFAQSNGALSW